MTAHRRPTRRATGFAGVLLAVALLVAACSVPTDGEARPLDPARLDAVASDKQNCGAPGVGTTSVDAHVYLVSQKDEPPYVLAVDRVIGNTDEATPYAVLNALVNCRVSEEDRRRGLATALPDDLQLLGVDPVAEQPGMFEVRLELLRNGRTTADDLDKLAVAQMFFTLTDERVTVRVRGVRFSVDGRPKAVNTDNRTVGVTSFVGRDDFAASSPRVVGTTTTAPTTTAAPTTAAPTTTGRGTGPTGATAASGTR